LLHLQDAAPAAGHRKILPGHMNLSDKGAVPASGFNTA
jgi:hypothetical protein